MPRRFPLRRTNGARRYIRSKQQDVLPNLSVRQTEVLRNNLRIPPLEAALDNFSAADEAKLDLITVTAPIDLDDLSASTASGVVVLVGTWDASAGSFPGGGTARAGDSYIVSVTGTVDGVDFTENDRVVALVDDASTSTYAANWHKLDYTDQVLSVAGRTGAVVLAADDLASGTLADARVAETNVTQHETALSVNYTQVSGNALTVLQRSMPPSDPADGSMVLWLSDGSRVASCYWFLPMWRDEAGVGADGDVMVKIQTGGVVKTATLIDYSAV